MGSLPNPYAELDELYSKLPKISCKGLCQESCGPIIASNLEGKRISNRVGSIGKVNSNNLCPLLVKESGSCSVYHIRPMICRLWGIAESMPCKFGCVPDPKYLTHNEGIELLRRAGEISTKLGQPGSFNTILSLGYTALRFIRAGV